MSKLLGSSWLQALIIIVLISFWFASGSAQNGIEEQAEIKPVKDTPTAVRMSRIEAQPFVVAHTVRAVVEAYESATIRAQTSGIVDFVNTKMEGKMIDAGEILCKVDVEDRKTNIRRARANLDLAKFELKGIQALRERNLSSQTEIAKAKVAVEIANTDVEKAKLELDYTEIKSKFKGIIDEIYLNSGDLVQIGAACARQINLDKIRLVGYVPEQKIKNFSVGQQIEVRLITGEIGFGEISLVSSSANKKVRTFRIEAIMDNTQAKVLENISAEMIIQTAPVLAHKIPTSSIVLNDDGTIVAKTLDESQALTSWPIEIISQTTTHLWVTGLPQTSKLVTLGQHYFNDGDTIKFVEEKIEAN